MPRIHGINPVLEALKAGRVTAIRVGPRNDPRLQELLRLADALAELPVGKSYVNCRQDIALPHGMPWHPRLSERLGLFRLVECDGSHEMFFSNPARLAQAIGEAGRD